MKPTLSRRIVAEFTGTLFLLAAVVGSGIMGEKLAAGNIALALLVNSLATGAALVAIILAFGPISGAHLNPAVTLCRRMARRHSVARNSGLHHRADGWSFRRSDCDSPHRRLLCRLNLNTRPQRPRPTFQRVRRDLRPPCSDLGDVPGSAPPPYRSPWAPTSLLPIGSPHPPHSPTLPLRSHDP